MVSRSSGHRLARHTVRSNQYWNPGKLIREDPGLIQRCVSAHIEAFARMKKYKAFTVKKYLGTFEDWRE